MAYGALLSTKLVGEGKYEAAIAQATRELGLQPDEPEAVFNRAQAKVALGQLPEAIADFELALSMDCSGSNLDPSAVDDELFDALRNLAVAQKDDRDTALATLQRYVATLPAGRHVDDIAKWTDHIRGVQTVWVREQA